MKIEQFAPEEQITRKNVNRRVEAMQSALEAGETGLSTHTGDRNNPHNVTAKQIGAEKWEFLGTGSASLAKGSPRGVIKISGIPANDYSAMRMELTIGVGGFNLDSNTEFKVNITGESSGGYIAEFYGAYSYQPTSAVLTSFCSYDYNDMRNGTLRRYVFASDSYVREIWGAANDLKNGVFSFVVSVSGYDSKLTSELTISGRLYGLK